MTRRRAAVAAPAVLAALAVTGCDAAASADGTRATAEPPGTLVVLAAASLTDVVTQLADRFEAQHPGVTVETGFAGSAALASQVVAGAPADVLLTADEATMTTVTDALGGDPVPVATNRLQIAVPAGNPGRVTGLADLGDPARTVALCAPEVPCGALAAVVLARAGVVPAPDTLEQDVRAVLTRVRLDEADAGLVYRTDVLSAAGEVEGVDVPDDVQEVAAAPALVLPDAPHAATAEAFVELLTGPVGRATLTAAGFGLP